MIGGLYLASAAVFVLGVDAALDAGAAALRRRDRSDDADVGPDADPRSGLRLQPVAGSGVAGPVRRRTGIGGAHPGHPAPRAVRRPPVGELVAGRVGRRRRRHGGARRHHLGGRLAGHPEPVQPGGPRRPDGHLPRCVVLVRGRADRMGGGPGSLDSTPASRSWPWAPWAPGSPSPSSPRSTICAVPAPLTAAIALTLVAVLLYAAERPDRRDPSRRRPASASAARRRRRSRIVHLSGRRSARPRRRRAAASSRPTAPGSPPARPHGWRHPALGDERHGHVLEHLRGRARCPRRPAPRRRRRSPAAAGSAAPAAGTPARAPRSACSSCWSWRCGRRSCRGAGRVGRPGRRRRSRSTPSRSPPMSRLFIVPCDAAPHPVRARPGRARRGTRRRPAG